MPYADPEVRRVRRKAARAANREWLRPKNRASVNARNAKRRKLTDAIKIAEGCKDCGYKKDARALQFDHIRGTKSGEVSALLSGNLDVLSAEVLKCDIRCANCHIIVTQERRVLL